MTSLDAATVVVQEPFYTVNSIGNQIEYTSSPDFDGKMLIISNQRDDNGSGTQLNRWYLAPGLTNHKTQDISLAQPFLFTRIKEGTNQGKYTIAFQNNDKTWKYLKADCSTSDTPIYFDLKIEDPKHSGVYRFSLWVGGNHIDQNNTGSFGSWNGGGKGSYLDFYDCNYIIGYDTVSYGEGKEIQANNSKIHWLSTGGVVGWSTNGYWCNFDSITLNALNVSGATQTGGLLGASGLSDTVKKVKINNCNAYELEIEITSSYGDDHRSVIGAFVGKTDQGKVVITGAQGGSYAKIKSLRIGITNNNRCVAGGLVGYAGNGCDVSNMTICPADSLGTNASITIGDKIAMAGGIVGLMQPQNDSGTANCTATFVNCTVKNVNVSAKKFAGGFYGGTWDNNKKWVPEKITIDNCRLIGCSSTNHNEVYGEIYAGGFVGNGRVLKNTSPNIEISNSTISNYDIVSVNDKYVGGFIGQADAEENGASVTCYVHDSAIENCKLGGNNNNYAGGVIGNIVQNADNKILGYNVKLSDITSGKAERMGAWVGYATSDTDTMKTTIQLVGMAIYGTGFEKNVGNDATLKNASFVFADYDGKCRGTASNGNTTYPTNISGYNYSSDTHVAMPKYPYVNINPQSTMGNGAYISGDGAVLYGSSVSGYSDKTADKTMAAKLYADLSDVSNTRRYTSFVDAPIKGTDTIEAYLKHTPGTDGNRISTYFMEKGITPENNTLTDVQDFAVVVINSSDNDENTELINRYIQLVTNTNTDYTDYAYRTTNNPYLNIDIKTCVYQNNKFQITNGQAGLRMGTKVKNVNGTDVNYTQFQLVSSDADQDNQFTLLDVQFKDPLDATKIAYHLYVPVYTIKQINVQFYASAMTGSSSISDPRVNDYISLMRESGRGTLIDSLDTWVTQYIRYRYSGEDINTLLAEGGVNWNYDKKVTFVNQQSGYTLPNNTFMVLVDPNGDQDKMYYANGISGFSKQNSQYATGQSDLVVELNKFSRQGIIDDGNGGTTTGDVPFDEQNLNVLIASAINESPGIAYTSGTENDYDVYRIYTENGEKKKAYYKYSSTGAGEYNLSVASNQTFDEDYYISMFIPTPDHYVDDTFSEEGGTPAYRLFYYEITPPAELVGARKAIVTNKFNYNVMIANLFEQDTSLQYNVSTDTDERQITESNNTLYVDAKCAITLKNENARAHLSGRNLYHAFNIMLNRYEPDSVTNDIQGLGNVTAQYAINGNGVEAASPSCVIDDERSTYLNVRTANIMSYMTGDSRTVQIAARVTIPFVAIDLEFPPGNSMETNIGVNAATTSNLSYYREKLAYTSMSKPFESSPNYYYIEDINNAVLDYNVVDMRDEKDKIGKKSFNYSRIGINGRSDSAVEEWMYIPTKADYNISVVENAEAADKLRITLWLEKKVDVAADGIITGAVYQPITNMENYLRIDSVKTGTNDTNSFSQNTELSTNGDASNGTPEKIVFEISNPYTNCSHLDGDIGYTFNINISAKTGINFTQYANYRIRLEAELIDVKEREVTT